ncbi:Regulator of nonsense transcripts 1 [Tritrichomonas foetus]|uniref:Regulator of nonsense transcripts 1 n=1 Tax=Tritrichomonas foetus TaxID=1144522 RepID=A0A1J4KNN9_9EUKA|nr:Regulator of nonsense transcripts 1 [Tritrichomonas foetus]|eukprot:OHT11412.1 Regulator of nonsense transcripts 1 [Tritrichomonas foetus]
MNELACEYCGCKNVNCLVKCQQTGLFFCNGKGDTKSSHIIHHLKTMRCTQICLPKQNPFSSVPLKCYICDSSNIFQLGFLQTTDGQTIFLVCRAKCQYDQFLIDKKVDNSNFRPIVSDGQILPEIVKIPEQDEYSKIPISKTILVTQKINEKNGKNEKINENIHGKNEKNENEIPSSFPHAKLEYESRDDFVDTMKQFIQAEREAIQSLNNTHLFSDISLDWKSDTHCSFKSPASLFRLVTLGSSLCFQAKEIKETGKIIKMSKNLFIEVEFSFSSLFAKQQCKVTINIVTNSIPYDYQLAALNTFQSNEKCMNCFLSKIILGQIENFENLNKLKGNTPQLIQPSPDYFYPLNSSQTKCIKTDLSQRFTMIQGFPGTGKTTVIAVLINSLVKNGIKPILVCAQSNTTIDFATNRIAQTGVNVCRVLSSSYEQVNRDIERFTIKKLAVKHFGEKYTKLIDFKNKNNESDSNNLDKYREKVTKMELKILQKSDVVCTTCTSAGSELFSAGIKFQAVIIDESEQCVDPDILIPLVYGCQQLVLVGDYRQFRPTTISKTAKDGRYDLPIMQRLILQGLRPSILKMQYRMHPALSEFLSHTFYGGFLKNGVTEAARTYNKQVVNWPNQQIPMFFWNIKSSEETYDNNNHSFINRQEIECVVTLINALYKAGVQGSEIGIIIPYVSQQALLIDSLPEKFRNLAMNNSRFFSELEIGSVDSFQGKEKNFIIFSAVRANSEKDIGFLKDEKRFCASLARAKFGLIIVGCAETFLKNKMWCKFIHRCIQEKVFVEGDLNSLQVLKIEALVSPEEPLFDDEDEEFNSQSVY